MAPNVNILFEEICDMFISKSKISTRNPIFPLKQQKDL